MTHLETMLSESLRELQGKLEKQNEEFRLLSDALQTQLKATERQYLEVLEDNGKIKRNQLVLNDKLDALINALKK